MLRLFCVVLLTAGYLTGADLVLRDGKVITLDPSRPQASAIAVTNGRISAVGSDAQIAREIGPATRVIASSTASAFRVAGSSSPARRRRVSAT